MVALTIQEVDFSTANLLLFFVAAPRGVRALWRISAKIIFYRFVVQTMYSFFPKLFYVK